jgi:hypothetical protein
MPAVYRAFVLIWSLAAIGVLYSVKTAGMARGSEHAFKQFRVSLIAESLVLTACAIALSAWAARRGRWEVAAGIVVALGVYGGLLAYLQWMG